MYAMWQSSVFRRTALVLLIALLCAFAVGQGVHPAQAQGTNLALHKPVTCSSTQSGSFPCANAVDGNTGTRWSSAFSDPQWIQIDLGATYNVTSVILRWETAYGKAFQIQVSPDAATWTNIYSTTTGSGGVQTIPVTGSGRYIRMYGTVRNTQWGYSLWEFEVYGTSGGTVTSTPTNTPVSGSLPDLTITSITYVGSTPVCANDPRDNVVVSNIGNASAGTFVVSFGQTTQTVNGLAAGQSATLSFTATMGTVTATADSTNVVVESNESNNSMSASLPIPTLATPCTPITGPSNTPTATPTLTRTATPSTNIALRKPVTCSSIENAGTPCASGVDGNTGTRWSSAFSDPQWIQIDLGTTYNLTSVVLRWEAAYGKTFQIQVSDNATTWTALYTTSTGTGGVQTIPVSGSGRYVRMYGIVRATGYGYSLWEFEVYAGNPPPTTVTPTPTSTNTSTGTIGPSLTPTRTPTASPTPSGGTPFWGDQASIPPAKNVMMFKFLNRTNGKYPDSQVFWSFNGQAHSIAEQSTFDMPANSAGRMYFGLGVPPVAGSPTTYWDFIEFTISPTVFNGNTTRVDAFGLKLAMRLHAADGYDVSVGENLSTFQEDRAVTFQRFIDAVPAEFDHLAQIQAPYRIVEPGAGEFKPGGLYATYYDAFVNQMWANNGLTIPKPGPNGSGLAAYPDISAAIFRHVGSAAGTFSAAGKLLNLSLWSNPGTFYLAAPANYYAKFWHDNAIDGKAYGFPYDDVGGYSSFISHGSPQYLIVAIGW